MLRKQPLFYIALLFCVLIFIRFQFPEKIPSNDISLQINKSTAPIFLRGVIASEVNEKDTLYGDRLVSFELKTKETLEKEDGQPLRVIGNAKVYLRQKPSSQEAKRRSNLYAEIASLPTVARNDACMELAYGDEVLLKGELRAPKGICNPGGFDSKAYLDRQGIRALFYGDSHAQPKVLNSHEGSFFRERMIGVKRFLSQSLTDGFNDRDAAFLKALFLGERSDMDNDFKDLFMKTGTMHILAVSGFNIGFLSLTFFFFLKPFRVPKAIKLWLTLVLIWLYCTLVGWQSPVVRASVMATVLIFGQLLGRKPNILNSLGLAALVILVINPKQLFDVGFELSFVAVFAIAQIYPIFLKPLELWPNEKQTVKEKFMRQILELFWISWVCLLITLPITVQNFYIVAPLSLLANLVVVPLSFYIFFTGTVFFLTFWWIPKSLFFIPVIIKILMQIFVASLFFIENLPGAYFIVGKLSRVLLTLLVLGIIFLLLEKRIKNSSVRAAALFLFILNIFVAQNSLNEMNQKFQMTMLDVGQGDAIYFEFPKGGNLLIDAGKGGEGDRGRWVITPFLKSKGVSVLDMLAITHPQEDHIGGMEAVLDEFRVKNVVDAGSKYRSKTFDRLKQKIVENKIQSFHAKREDRIQGFRDVEIKVLHPQVGFTASKNVNDESLVLKISTQGVSFLMTGDIHEKAIRMLLNSGQDIRADVFKVPHHGAKLGASRAEFLKVVNPKISVISVGEKNAFHQPVEETLKALNAIPGNRIYRTDQHHAIEIVSRGGEVHVVDNRGSW